MSAKWRAQLRALSVDIFDNFLERSLSHPQKYQRFQSTMPPCRVGPFLAGSPGNRLIHIRNCAESIICIKSNYV